MKITLFTAKYSNFGAHAEEDSCWTDSELCEQENGSYLDYPPHYLFLQIFQHVGRYP